MKRMKKFMCVFLVVLMCMTSAPLQGFVELEWPSLPEINFGNFELPKLDFGSWFSSKASAAEGYYTYTVTNGKATITSVNASISGDITIPATLGGYSVTTIGDYAFFSCDSLASVTIPDSVTTIGDYAFFSCDSLASVTIPDSVTTIGDEAFGYCYSLASVTIPDSVTTIGDLAFYSCYSLTSITIPDSVTTIGDLAFYTCHSLTSIVVDADNPAYSSDSRGALFDKNKTILIQYPIGNTNSSYSIPNSVTTIGDYAFFSCDSLTSITIPNSVTTIGDYAFFYCHSLASVTIPDSVTTIGDLAFYSCDSLTSIVVDADNPAYSSDSRGALFDKNKTILIQYPVGNTNSSYSIPDSVTTIGDYAFFSCDSLTSITIPNSVTTIGDYAFVSCDSLTSITIPDSVTTIGDEAFYSCDSLTQITIPESITSIGEGAFKWCDSLLDVYYQGAEEQWKEISIGDYNECLTNATIHYNSSADEPLPELKLNFEELTISNNVCPSIYVESYPDGVTKEDIVWTSSNERVAYINGSTVNPIQYGKTLITASTKDGKYSASCELTVQSSFVITSTTSSLSSIKAGEEAEYSIMLLDYEGNKLPVENVALSNESSKYLEIIKHERTETEIKLTVKGLKAGAAVLEFDNDEPLTYSKFVFDIYPATVTYRADKVPVRNEELKTNFSRAGLFVENFRYFAVGEPAEYYTALMNVYNKNSSVGIVASYTQDGKLYDIAEIKKHQAMPTDYFEFLSVLGKGAVDIALGNNYNYRYSIESTKTEIEIDVPINGYITVSNDVTSCPVTFVYGIMSVAVSTAFQLAEDLTSIEKSKESDVVKELTKKVTNYFTKDPKILDKFIKELSKKILKETTKSNITFMGEYTLDLACKIFAEIELNFEDVLKDVLLEVLKDSAHNFVSMALMKTFLSNDIIKTAEGGYIKAAEAMFTVADNVNVIDEIIDFTHSAKSGITTITFGKCDEDGFVCKDVIRVNLKEEQEILDSLYLQHYQIYIDKNLFPLRPGFKDLDLKENSVIEVHEITIMRDGVPYEIKQKASVEIDIPDNWTIFNFRIYRVEPDGKITNMFATVANGKAYFTTDHFSEYIFVGELEADHTHSYTVKTIEPTHTQKGIKTFTCICGDTYTEEIEKLKEHTYTSAVTKEPTHLEEGVRTFSCACGDSYIETIERLKEHTFGDKDEKCECGFDRTEGCSCNCHKGGISGFFFKIILFFQKLFKSNQICKCGIKHY